MISPTVAPLSSFAEEQSPEMMDRIFEEFNSLSVIYRRPSQAFIKVRRFLSSHTRAGESLHSLCLTASA